MNEKIMLSVTEKLNECFNKSMDRDVSEHDDAGGKMTGRVFPECTRPSKTEVRFHGHKNQKKIRAKIQVKQ